MRVHSYDNPTNKDFIAFTKARRKREQQFSKFIELLKKDKIVNNNKKGVKSEISFIR